MTVQKRRSFEADHFRKFLLVIDGKPEVDSALYYAANRMQRSQGSLVMLYIIVPQDFQHWINVRQQHVEEETAKAKALFRLMRRKLNLAGYENIACEEIIREGTEVDEIRKLIDEDEDIAVLVLGAASEAAGPGPLVSSLATSGAMGSFPIPITIVPGTLALEDVRSLD
ncbi:universal stress protein [Hyphomicrobium sulfonivorans]|nr:universal stress protein [Hyphomicrobium sulfonivorans]